MAIFYVYVLFRPNGIPCYVGKGKNARWIAHERAGCNHSNKHLARIIVNAGGALPKIKVREGLTEAEAIETEIALIAAIGRGNYGPLVNLTNGGDGISGFIQTRAQHEAHLAKMNTPEIIEKCRKNATGNTVNRGRRHSIISKQNMSDGGKGKILSDEHKNAIRNGMLNSETHKKVRAAYIGKTHTDRTRAKMRESQARRRATERDGRQCL